MKRGLAFAALLIACATAATGCAMQAGDSCQADADCGGDLICTRAPGAPASEPGVCAPRLGDAGDPCEQTADCRSGLFCSNDVPAEPERYGECTPVRPAGEPCRRDEDCQDGLTCAPPAEADSLGICSAAALLL